MSFNKKLSEEILKVEFSKNESLKIKDLKINNIEVENVQANEDKLILKVNKLDINLLLVDEKKD
jgi:hypothetical protein